MEKSENASVDESVTIAVGMSDLPRECQERIEVLQGLITAPNAKVYRERV
jgi:hypothetical protein